jgi:hypothetical protein
MKSKLLQKESQKGYGLNTSSEGSTIQNQESRPAARGSIGQLSLQLAIVTIQIPTLFIVIIKRVNLELCE